MLAQLSEKEALVGLEKVPLDAGQILEAPGTPTLWVYFIESGLVSIVAAMSAKHRIEVGMIGFEGMTGSAIVSGDDRSINTCIVQSAGEAYRISAADLNAALLQHPRLVALCQRYIQVLMAQVSQTALAAGRGRLRERLARWILMRQDRLQQDGIVITHQSLSRLLGVRRPGVTVALQVLEGDHLIKASRTLIRILDRDGLNVAASGFYGIPEAEYARSIGPLPPLILGASPRSKGVRDVQATPWFMPAFAPLTIAGLSKLSGVDAEVIRHYMALGLVPPPRQRPDSAAGVAYHCEHLDRLRFITRALVLGFSLKTIGQLLGMDGKTPTCADVYTVAQRTLAAIRALGIVPSPTLERLTQACPQRGGPADCPILAELARPDDLVATFRRAPA